MDSEHRHDLEENALARWLAEQIDQIKPQLPTLLLLAFLALAVGVGWSVYTRTASASRADAWRDYSLAIEDPQQQNVDSLQRAMDSDDADVMEWSTITFADGRVWQAANLYLVNREESDKALDEAEDFYNALVRAGNEEISDRAVYGLARVYEMRGNLDKARDQYAKVRGPFAEIAANRAEELASPRVVEDYAWLTHTEAKPVAPPTERPDLEADDIQMPEEDADTAMDEIFQSFDVPAGDQPAEPELEADDETVSEDDPAAQVEAAAEEAVTSPSE